jgi:hypothetical protein
VQQKARPYQAERITQVDLRYQEIELPPPSEHRDKAPVKVWVVHLREYEPAGRGMPGTPGRSAVLRYRDRGIECPRRKKNIEPPMQLGEAVQLVAALGGYLGRKNDPPSGHQIMWRGYAKLQILYEGYLLGRSVDQGFLIKKF